MTETIEASQPTLPRAWRVTEAVSSLGTRLSFFAVAWALVAGGTSWPRVGVVLSAQVVAYLVGLAGATRLLDRYPPGRLSVAADLASALAVAAVAFLPANLGVLCALVAALGLARAGSDVAKNVLSGAAPAVTEEVEPAAPPRESLIGLGLVLAGGALGAAVAWLGAPGALWLLALVFSTSAARVVLASGPRLEPLLEPVLEPAGAAEVAPSLTGAVEPRRLVMDRRLLAVLFTAGLLAFVAAVLLLGVWAGEVFSDADPMGPTGGAFIVGALGGAVVFTAFAAPPLRLLLIGLGYLAGAGVVSVLNGLEATRLLVFAVAMLAGLAVATAIPVVGLRLTAVAPPGLRARVGAVAAAAATVGIPAGAFAAAWLVSVTGLLVGIAVAAGCLLGALLTPVLAYRLWQEMAPDRHVPILRRTPRLSARLAVTLSYSDGQWLVEVRKGRALLGSRYLVRSSEALSMLSVLDVPALTDRVEKALDTDKTEASRQVERMRQELAELETKLSGLTEMVNLSEAAVPPPEPTPERRPESA